MTSGLIQGRRRSAWGALWLALAAVIGTGLTGCTSTQPVNTATTQAVASQSTAMVPSSDPASAAASASVPAEQPPTASASPAVASFCPVGTQLPAGIDPRVCGPAPASPVTLNPAGMFVLPSGNIWCDFGDSYAHCGIDQSTFPPAPEPTPPQGAGDWFGSGFDLAGGTATQGYAESNQSDAEWALSNHLPITTLEYGQATVAGTAVCLAQSIGLSCWDASTTHGFFLSRTQALVW